MPQKALHPDFPRDVAACPIFKDQLQIREMAGQNGKALQLPCHALDDFPSTPDLAHDL